MRITIISVIFLVSLAALGQTRIAPPAAKLNLAELGQMDKIKVKKFKKLDRFKDKKAKLISKQLKRHTGFSKEEIEGYTSMVKGLDSLGIETFEQNLELVIANQKSEYTGEVDRIQKERDKGKKLKKEIDTYRSDSVSLKNYQPTLANAAISYVQDSLQQLADKQLDYGVELDTLNKLSIDSARVANEILARSKLEIDSSYLDYINPTDDLVGYDSTINSDLENDSLLYASMETNVEWFIKAFAQKQIDKQDLGVSSLEGQQIPSVQQFIPELEKFDYQKPKIPDEKLTKALIDQEKEKKKERLKDAVLPKLQRGKVEEQEVNWINRWQIGGFIDYRPENNLIEVTPTLAYGILDKLSLGVGYSTVILLEKDTDIDRQIAYRSYLDYLLVKSFYIHIESEWKEQQKAEIATVRERSTLLGIGRNFSYKSISTSILGLFNLSAPNAIDTKRFSVRFAVNFNP